MGKAKKKRLATLIKDNGGRSKFALERLLRFSLHRVINVCTVSDETYFHCSIHECNVFKLYGIIIRVLSNKMVYYISFHHTLKVATTNLH